MQYLWIGSVNGLHAVVDSAIQLENSRGVLIYVALHKRLIHYEKSHGRSIWKDFAGDEDAAHGLREEYRVWRAAQRPEQIAAAIEILKRNDLAIAERLEDATVKHRARLAKRSLRYGGVTVPDGWGFVRNAECFDCHRALGSETHLECGVCRWIVCSKCAGCGCTSPARSAYDSR
jgi:hypothetical protein